MGLTKSCLFISLKLDFLPILWYNTPINNSKIGVAMPISSVSQTSRKMDFQMFFIIAVCLCAVSGFVFAAGPQIDWTARYNGQANSNDYATDMAIDLNGFVYVSGYAKNIGTNEDFVTIKYSPDGNTIWTRMYDRHDGSDDRAEAIAIDANSNIIVAGWSKLPTSLNYDGAVVKYNSAGTELWKTTYGPIASDDKFFDVAADAGGNIYVVGTINGDGLIIKYTPDGNTAWVKTYDGTGSSYDALYKVAIDGSGNIYACGETAGTGTGQDCLIVKYSPDNTLLWMDTYNGSANRWDLLKAITLDSAGNVYVTGSVETVSDSNYVTMKYSPVGSRLWTAFYTGTATGSDESRAIAVSSDGNVVVTGYSEGAASVDAATVKYNSATGAQVWASRYNGAGNSTDYAQAIAADNFGNVYIHGTSVETGSADYLTICYDSNGAEKWKMNYNANSLADIGSAQIIVDNNNMYVTGYSMASANNYDYVTIKYVIANLCPVPPAGDLNGDCQVNFLDLAVFANSYAGWETGYLTLKDIADTWLDCGLANQGDCWQ